MKKFFPAGAIFITFIALLASQMLINGQELSASRVKNNQEMYMLYENQFKVLKGKTTQGENIDLSKLKQDIIIINFWASWCRPCISEFKSLNKLIKKFGNKIFVLGINNDTKNAKKAVLKVEKEYKLAFQSMLDEKTKYSSAFNVTKIPTSIIFYKGKVLEFSKTEFDFMSNEFLALLSRRIN